MRAALIVGGDRITSVKQVLASQGIDEITHWSGRKPGDARHPMPQNAELVVILIDWINHTLAEKVKRNARSLGKHVLYAKGNGGSLRMPHQALH